MSIDFIKSIYYELLSYLIPQKVEYKIKGECTKCGNCCREIRIYGMETEKELKIMKFFFPRYRSLYIYKKDENNNFVLSCTHLNENGTCNIYNKRPNFCKRYPSTRLHYNIKMPDGCGYYIETKNFKDYL